MSAIKNYNQFSSLSLLLLLLLVNSILSGCQSIHNLAANKSHDQLIKHEFVLYKKQDIVGELATIRSNENDTLPDIARHFGLGFNDIIIANPQLDTWLLHSGDQVVLPTRYIIPEVKRKGIILNLANMRLFQFPKHQPNQLITYPIGIGRDGWDTPTGLTKIIEKKKNPVWRVPDSIRKEHAEKGDPLPRIVKSGPDNPLGDYAMRLALPSYLIHGTNKPYGVGMQISHGCVRLYPENIAPLFQQTPRGTQVRIVNQPYLLGWDNQMLYLEAHKPLKESKKHKKRLFRKLKKISRKKNIEIDWEKVEQILVQANGIPIPTLVNTANLNALVFEAISLSHPQRFYQQPVVKPLNKNHWSITVATFSDDDTAKKLVALLNHQGPPIPTRKFINSDRYDVIAGPFESKKEVQSVIAKLKREFQFNAIAHPPQSKQFEENYDWSLSGLVDNIF